MAAPANNTRSLWETVSRVAFIVLTLFIGLLAFEGRSVLNQVGENRKASNDNDKRITRIEANRYTSADAVTDRREQSRELAAVRQDVANQLRELRQWFEAKYPPKWLQDDLNEVKRELKMLRDEVKSRRQSRALKTGSESA